jgi:glycosyltransferase involved in cell wall biosynthesis
MAFPKVSIVIPAYKPGHFEQCLRSAIGQTYTNTEILVSDNCPTEAIKDICARFPQVTYQRNTVTGPQNVIDSFFSGRGELIKPLFDDDILHPFCVERMVAAISMRDDIELVFSTSQVIDAENNKMELRRAYTASGYLVGRDLHRNMALGLHNIVGEFTSIMFRRKTLWDIGPRRLYLIGGHDYMLGLADIAAYCNLMKDGSAFYIDEELTYFRHDQRLMSNSNPAANPNFGYCFSDYIDLLVGSHQTGVITTTEIVAMEGQLNALSNKLNGVFEQVGRSFQRYRDYIQEFKGA